MQSQGGLESLRGLRDSQTLSPLGVFRGGVRWHGIGRQTPAVPIFDRRAQSRRPIAREQIDHGLTVLRHESVQVDEPGDALRHAVGDSRGDHPAVAVADEHETLQPLEFDDLQQVLDMGIQVDRRIGQMLPLSEAGIGRGDQAVSGGRHQRMHLPPRPSRGPRTVRNQEGCLPHKRALQVDALDCRSFPM